SHLSVGFETLECRSDIFGGSQHIEDVYIWSPQVFFEHESQLDFDTRMRVFLPLEYVTGFKYLVVKNDPVIRFINTGSRLHSLGRQPNFATSFVAAGFDLAVGPDLLDGV